MSKYHLTEDENRRIAEAVLSPFPEYIHAYRSGAPLPDWCTTDIERHTTGRLEEFRSTCIPWLEQNLRLDGASVLEIGAGTGSSSVAIAEKGASLVGIDIDTWALEIASLRSGLHGIANVQFKTMNAVDIATLGQEFDLIVFFATLEHMTYDERKSALATAWSMIKPNGNLAIIECPNRLWYYDNHTTLSNFFNWLPDELAIDYARFSSRDEFCKALGSSTNKAVDLARWGRGASYHELEIAIAPLKELQVRPALTDYRRSVDHKINKWWQSSTDAKYRELLQAIEPSVPSAFFYPWLDVLIHKG